MEIEAEKKIAENVYSFLTEQAKSIKEDKETPINDRLLQMDLVLDLMKFTQNHKELAKVLNKHLYNTKFKPQKGVDTDGR